MGLGTTTARGLNLSGGILGNDGSASIIAPGREGSQLGAASRRKSLLIVKDHTENLCSKRFTMAALSQPDFELAGPLASDEQFLGEELSRDPAEEKLQPGWGGLIVFSASLALWAMIFFVASRFF